MSSDLFEYALRIGDDALVAAQRLIEWVAAAPEMEEDVALANIALDQLGVAREMLTYAGEIEGAGRTEDDLAYLRDAEEFRNCLLIELPNTPPHAARPVERGAPGDFAVTMAKLLFFSAFQLWLYEALTESADERLAAIADKARKESRYHLDHAALWTVRLGDGTDESHRRMQAAVDLVWPYTHELFATDEVTQRLVAAGVAPDPHDLRPQWRETCREVLAEATLDPPADGPAPHGGRQGWHTEHLVELLAQMQAVHRAYPGVRW